MTDRPPAVAGMFYEGTAARLAEQVARCFDANERAATTERFIGAVVPHAGLMYSGAVAAALYDRLQLPRRLIILCPNHTGAGAAAAINSSGGWITPLGRAPVDAELASSLARRTPILQEDSRAHAREHSLEVQLPFLQTLATDFTFVPICLRLGSFEHCRILGDAIADEISHRRAEGDEVAILASSDMNHYEDQTTTLEKDQRAIDRILDLDPEGLWNTVLREDISMCGFIPTTVMLVAVRRLGATSAKLVRHATSGDVTGDYSAVVGYASILIS